MHDSNLNRLYDYVIRWVIWYILYGDVTSGNALKFNYMKNMYVLSIIQLFGLFLMLPINMDAHD